MLSTPITVRWGAMDSYGHVNNVLFVGYFEDTLAEWLGDQVPFRIS